MNTIVFGAILLAACGAEIPAGSVDLRPSGIDLSSVQSLHDLSSSTDFASADLSTASGDLGSLFGSFDLGGLSVPTCAGGTQPSGACDGAVPFCSAASVYCGCVFNTWICS